MNRFKKLITLLMVAIMLGTAFPETAAVLTNLETVEAATIKINKKSTVLIKGQQATLKITGTSKKVKWTTSNNSVAVVSSKGVVTAKKKGTATIKAKVGSKNYNCKVTVETPSLSKTALTINTGSKSTIKLHGTSRNITWSSSNTSVATVSKGTITAKKAGSTNIIAKVLGKKYVCKVTVKKASPKAGTRENPLSAYTSYTTNVYNYATYLGKFKIQLLDYKDGKTALDYVMQNPWNTMPTSGQEYIYVKFKITYVSGYKQVYATNVINYFSNFFNSSSNSQLNNINWGFDFEDVDNMVHVSLYPGGSTVCSAAILVRSGNSPITYRVQTGFDSSKSEYTYKWFKTKK